MILFILLEELIYSIYYMYYRFCLKCINDNNNKPKCIECPIELIFKGLKIVSNDKTLDEIIYKNKSISRFGDGELRIIFGENLGFQTAAQQFKKKIIRNIKYKG